ncbi:F0F1 ATP synthase subunit B [Paracoccus sp. (in: a-proteobacteria)]|uniref:F0F1 ATP synthase subunit B n=1 Tax=Paracoccus sp. TaxID=267 RepID=UPI0026E04254|nr:F0F1 ATP synthase subunit B [Paracoccus sp. (in: a-proteobacteria)]MDO5369210.1 F0F1 ATP synthase subunit B [Paracoccus sp. (in: a-proteobacteria)]
MIARLTALAAAFAASPALAAEGAFFSLANTDFIVLLAFLAFIGILLYYKVPGAIGRLLDRRAEGIKADISEARRLRDEAQEIYASYERRQREVHTQAGEIVANAKREAVAQADKAKVDLQKSIERRLQAAQDQITAAENDAIRAVRNQAIQVAMAAATEVLGRQMGPQDRAAGIDRAIDDVARHLN